MLGSRDDLFRFNFPKGFIPDIIVDKYNPYLRRINSPFESVSDLVNYSITGLNLTGVSVEPVRQTLPVFDVPMAIEIFRSSIESGDILESKSLTINFSMLDGFVNYWVILETFWFYYDFKRKQHYSMDLHLQIFDSDGIMTCQTTFQYCIPTKISDLSLTFGSPSTSRKDFSMDVEFMTMKIDFMGDEISIF